MTGINLPECLCAMVQRDENEHGRTQNLGGQHMHEADNSRGPALAELRGRLEEARAQVGLNQTELAGLAGLGRATVGKALALDGGVPSANTVARLARVLKLSAGELLELRRTAMDEVDGHPADMPGPGRPIEQWEPHELEVHPAGPGTIAVGERALPGYVKRRHDEVLAAAVREAAQGRSRIVVLVGSSSTGKTRACWEAVQPLATKRWRLWHHFDPPRAEAALEELRQVGPRTVVWLNEAQRYLGDRKFGEEIAAAVHRLLTDEQRGPVLVLGTLWPEYAAQYTALAAPGGDDPHTRVRELLTGRTVAVPDAFDAAALTTATLLAEEGDPLLADALTRAHDGRITQDLAGAPDLLRRYEQSTPPARALLHAAMDARRLGVGPHILQTFLTDAAPDYLSQDDYDQLPDDWAEQAYAELAKPGHGKQAPLRRVRPRPQKHPPIPPQPADRPAPQPADPVLRLADYLEQHGRSSRIHLCPPASFWQAAHTHLIHPEDLANLTVAAETRHRLQWSRILGLRATSNDTPWWVRMGHLQSVVARNREAAEVMARQAADEGDTSALFALAGVLELATDREGAQSALRQAADLGSVLALGRLAVMLEETGDREEAEALARQAAEHGNTSALARMAESRVLGGDWEGAEILARQAASYGDTSALVRLAALRELAEDWKGAESLLRQAADLGSIEALVRLAALRETAGDQEVAEALARQAASYGDTSALVRLAALRETAGDQEVAEALARQAASYGDTSALVRLATLRETAGDQEVAEALARQAASYGDTSALVRLATLRETAGDRAGAESLLRQAADHGDSSALVRLAEAREMAGNRQSAESLLRQAADRGIPDELVRRPKGTVLHRLWPYGLNPDGTPTRPWEQQ
ncbi:transcriptional regulator with XRE-family HTH domain [Streptomyces sp. SAI-208]|nr:transcriptional regulator with XRE-family HTH domain [Streptomyces sp. SAI-208]